jgi:hypothetical protein
VSEYIRELIRADQKRHAKAQLEQVFLSAVNFGDPMEVTPEMVEQVRLRRAKCNNQRTDKPKHDQGSWNESHRCPEPSRICSTALRSSWVSTPIVS